MASPDVMHPRTHVVLGPGAPSSEEPFQATEEEEGLGCWRLLKATMSSMWCAVLCTSCGPPAALAACDFKYLFTRCDKHCLLNSQ